MAWSDAARAAAAEMRKRRATGAYWRMRPPKMRVGQLVKFQTPGPAGLMRLAGVVKLIKPDGIAEVKGQHGGYYQLATRSK